MKRITNRRLAQISTLDELQAMRHKVDRAIGRFESNMADDYHAAKSTYSMKDVAYLAIDAIDEVQSILRYVISGVRSASSLFSKRRRRRGPGGTSEWVYEEDFVNK